MLATWPLWTPAAEFPQVPLIRAAGSVSPPLEWGLLAVALFAATSLILIPRGFSGRVGSLCLGLSVLSLVLINQHRLQPWAWQFLILSLILTSADDRTVRDCWRMLIISIYAWSAWSKLDWGFVTGHGRYLLEGFFRSIHLPGGLQAFPPMVQSGLSAAVPVFELLVAAGLCWRPTRNVALSGATSMHVGLLLALGPLGHQHQPGVLVWNLFFLLQNWLLFYGQSIPVPSDVEQVKGRWRRQGNLIGQIIVAAAIFWPSVEGFGLCDHWPAWAVYAALPERVSVYLHHDEFNQLSADVKPYLETQWNLDEWSRLRIDRWSLDAVKAPIYPQDRFQVGVAIAIRQRFDLKHLRVVIEGPANRWTGKRRVDQYSQPELLDRLAASYRWNAFPRTVTIPDSRTGVSRSLKPTISETAPDSIPVSDP